MASLVMSKPSWLSILMEYATKSAGESACKELRSFACFECHMINPVNFDCMECEKVFCRACFDRTHANLPRQRHCTVELKTDCSSCNKEIGRLLCYDCNERYCLACHKTVHGDENVVGHRVFCVHGMGGDLLKYTSFSEEFVQMVRDVHKRVNADIKFDCNETKIDPVPSASSSLTPQDRESDDSDDIVPKTRVAKRKSLWVMDDSDTESDIDIKKAGFSKVQDMAPNPHHALATQTCQSTSETIIHEEEISLTSTQDDNLRIVSTPPMQIIQNAASLVENPAEIMSPLPFVEEEDDHYKMFLAENHHQHHLTIRLLKQEIQVIEKKRSALMSTSASDFRKNIVEYKRLETEIGKIREKMKGPWTERSGCVVMMCLLLEDEIEAQQTNQSLRTYASTAMVQDCHERCSEIWNEIKDIEEKMTIQTTILEDIALRQNEVDIAEGILRELQPQLVALRKERNSLFVRIYYLDAKIRQQVDAQRGSSTPDGPTHR